MTHNLTVPVDTEDGSASPPGQNPYPGSDKLVWTQRFADALAEDTGLPHAAALGLAVYVSQPKRYLISKERAYRLRPGVIVEKDGLRILQVEVHGFAGTPAEFNERVRTSFDSPVRADAMDENVLPSLTTGTTSDGQLAPYLTTAAPVSKDRQARLLEKMDQSLTKADSDRGYDLQNDIRLFGQQERTMHVVFVRQILESGDMGQRIRHVVDLPAIKGANRSRARLALFGLTVNDVIFGVRRDALNNRSKEFKENPDKHPVTADPVFWVPAVADLLRESYSKPESPGYEVALRAAKVATVPIQIIVGARSLNGFHTAVFDPNRIDHRRPPLDYGLADRAASDMRAVLRAAATRGDLTEPQRAWLSGEGGDPAPVKDEDLVDRRDRRDQLLFATMFPANSSERTALRQVLGEPAPSNTGRRNVDARTRMISAAVADGYTKRWNPRILDGLFSADSIKNRNFFISANQTWQELLVQAENGDLNALSVFIHTRGMHWLAEHGIVEADRGSVAAQHDGDDVTARRIRRTMISIRDSLKRNPARAIGLMRELARAANVGEEPREVDHLGEPIDGSRASRAWFNDAFPKTARPPKPQPSDDPELPAPTPAEELLWARKDFVDAVLETLPQAFVEVLAFAGKLDAAAVEASLPAIPDDLAESLLKEMNKAVKAVRSDTKTLGSLLGILQEGGADAADFESACKQYLEESADPSDDEDDGMDESEDE